MDVHPELNTTKRFSKAEGKAFCYMKQVLQTSMVYMTLGVTVTNLTTPCHRSAIHDLTLHATQIRLLIDQFVKFLTGYRQVGNKHTCYTGAAVD